MAAVSVWIGAFLTREYEFGLPLLLAMAAALTLCAAGNVLNDLLDTGIDRIAHPDRVLVRGLISRRAACVLCVLCNLIGLVLASMVSVSMLMLAATTMAALALYNIWLKRVLLVGNVVVSLLGGLTLIVGGMAVSPDHAFDLPGPLVGAVLGFLFHLVREIVKDTQDIKGDRSAGIVTFPQAAGRTAALWTAVGIFVVLGAVAYWPWHAGWYRTVYGITAIVGVVIPLLPLLVATALSPTDRRLAISASALKVGMAVGMLALVLGKPS
jgi:geranylgeranylglycerol-phosphate geranylgeranyltransferase